MQVYEFLTAAASFVRGRKRPHSPSPEDSPDESVSFNEQDAVKQARAAAKASLPFECHSACSEVDALIARVISIDLEREDTDPGEILPSIEVADDYFVDGQTRLNFKDADDDLFLSIQKPPRTQKINGLDIEGKYISQVGHARRLCSLGWNIETILVYLKLARRGYEPLFSTAWKLDFPKFPSILFTHDDESVFIKTLQAGRSLSHGVLDFDRFCGLGRDIRCAERRKFDGEQPAAKLTAISNRFIQRYIKAVWIDAKLWDAVVENRLPELVMVVTGSPAAGIDQLSEFAEDMLRERAREVLNLLKGPSDGALGDYVISPPVIFGIVAFDSVVGVMACEPLSPELQIRNLGFYHFDKQHEEVWNCISLAILVFWARNSTLRIKDALNINVERMRLVVDPDL
jgi:hypothetical protein